MKDLLKKFYVIGFRFQIGFDFIRVWASIFSLTFNSVMKGFPSLKRMKGLAGTWRLTLDKTGETRLKWQPGYVEEPPGGTPGKPWWGCAAPFSKSWPYLRLKMILSTPDFRLSHYNPDPFSDLKLLRFKNASKKISQNLFRIRILSFFLIQLEVNDKTIPVSRSRWAKSISVFGPKRRKNHTLWGIGAAISVWLI